MYQMIPLVMFFVSYFYYHDILLSTKIIIGATIICTIAQKLITGVVPKSDQITFWALIILGGTTVMLNDPLYLQWKLTVTFYLFAIIAIVNMWLDRQPICQILLGEKIDVMRDIWRTCDFGIIIFSTLIGTINAAVVIYCSLDFWVWFKFIAIIMSTTASIFMAVYLMRHANTIK